MLPFKKNRNTSQRGLYDHQDIKPKETPDLMQFLICDSLAHLFTLTISLHDHSHSSVKLLWT